MLFNLSLFFARCHSVASLPAIPESHHLNELEMGSLAPAPSWGPEKKAIPWKLFGGLFLKGGKSLVIRLDVFWRIVKRLNLAGGVPKSRSPQTRSARIQRKLG